MTSTQKKTIHVFQGFWTPEDCKKNPTWLFVYGDNDAQIGKKGQAVIRDEHNSIGIPTKKYPTLRKEHFYTDNELESNKRKIDNSLSILKEKLRAYETLVIPKDGIGTGLAQLNVRAPLTFKYLQEQLDKLVNHSDI